MPRQARLDAPGLMHHVMARGLNRQHIFESSIDRQNFLTRIPAALERSPNQILAWALMPNHVHFLIRSGPKGIAPFFRRLFTGYAMAFNKRHRRVGYLFQGRYKSIVCDEDEYFLTLVRYIHLNPVAANIVPTVAALNDYPFTGHSAVIGKVSRPWQAVDEVLGHFGKNLTQARKSYVQFLEDGLSQARELATDLAGAGLLEHLHETRTAIDREDDRPISDDRVLGDSDFIQHVWNEVNKQEKQTAALKRRGIDVRRLVKRIARACGVPERSLFQRDRRAAVSAAKAALIFAGVEYLGQTTTAMAALTKIAVASASRARVRGQLLQKKFGISKLIK